VPSEKPCKIAACKGENTAFRRVSRCIDLCGDFGDIQFRFVGFDQKFICRDSCGCSGIEFFAQRDVKSGIGLENLEHLLRFAPETMPYPWLPCFGKTAHGQNIVHSSDYMEHQRFAYGFRYFHLTAEYPVLHLRPWVEPVDSSLSDGCNSSVCGKHLSFGKEAFDCGIIEFSGRPGVHTNAEAAFRHFLDPAAHLIRCAAGYGTGCGIVRMAVGEDVKWHALSS